MIRAECDKIERAAVVLLAPQDQVKYMVDWFFAHYEDPVHSQPWDEGEYVFLVDECNAGEELEEMFGGAVDDALLRTATEKVEDEGWQWVRIADLDNFEENDDFFAVYEQTQMQMVRSDKAMTEQLIIPTCHLNGTPREALLQQLLDAINALDEAAKALAKAGPHGRDYYPQGDHVIYEAMRQHESRFARLASVRAELEQIAEAL